MGSSKRNLLTSILLLVVMGIFAVLTIFIVVDAINKKYYNDIKVEYEVQEESPNIILTFARSEGSNFSTDNTKVVLSEDNKKFRIDGTVPEIQNGVVTNLDDLTSSDGREFYFFSTNSSFIDPQEDPENPNFIFSKTDSRYYVSTEDNPIWYDVPKSSENLTLYSVFLTPNVHNSDFANAPLLSTSPNVIISHDVTEIPYNAFSNALMERDLSMAAKIEGVVIPNSVESINSKFDMMSGIVGGAFAACTTLIPSSVEYVGGEAFMSCTGLDTVKYENGCYLPTENNEHAILIDTNLKATNVTIHEDCISIQGGTFSKYYFVALGLIPSPELGEGESEDYINMNLQKITISKNVKSIGMGAFTMCMGLENVVFEGNSNLTNIGMYSFAGCSSLKTINLEDTKIKELKDTFSGCSSLTSITIPSGVTSIEGAFSGCSSLTSITIPSGVTSIEGAFSGCSSLTSITIPDSVTSIGNSAFRNCIGLTSITFEDMTGLTNIGTYIFAGCDNVKQLTIQSGEVKDLDFSDLSNLTTVTLGDGVTSIGSYAFSDCSSLETVTFGENSQLTSIGRSAFYYCDGLTSITIPEGVTSIGTSVFRDCSSLTSITIPEGVTSIGEDAFYGCSSLISITIPNSVTSIERGVFNVCSSLTSITIPDSVTSIGEIAFNNCISLTSITIPEKVTSIGVRAFQDCSSLTSITIPDSVTSIGGSAFYGCNKLVEVYDLTGPNGLKITKGSYDNGCVGYYADYVYTDKDTDLVQKVVNNDYIFYYNNDIMYLLSYIGSDKELTLPSIDKVKEVFGDFGDTYEIYEYAFYEDANINSVVMPNCVTSIGDSAFYNCYSITSITIPDSVTSIGEDAFSNCESLTSITIPDSVTSIGEGAFTLCDNLKIYCEVESKPSGWVWSWNWSDRPVYWAGEWKMVDGVPTPIESGVEGVGYSDVGEDFGIGFDGLGFREELYFNDKRERKVV